MVSKTQFEVKVPSMDTSNEGKITMAFNYHLICDKLMREIMSSHGYIYFGLSIYALNMDEGLQK